MSAAPQARIIADRVPATRQHRVLNVVFENDDRLLLSVVEAARRLGIGRTLMYELLASGDVRSVHVGRLRKVPVEALDAYVAGLVGHGASRGTVQ
jgi:excisionase family DNA binding protein